MIGYKDPAKIYLIDFGLSQAYIQEKLPLVGSMNDNDQCSSLEMPKLHIQKQNLAYFSGNFMFASLNSCRGNNKSRRDDIESIFYLIIYLYNENYLPWRDFKGTFK